jgi:hypothetical protein
LGEFETNTPHVPGTTEPPGPAELVGAAGPAGAAGPVGAAGPLGMADPAWLHASGLKCPYSLEHDLDECDSLKKCQFDQRVEARITWINWPTYSIAQPPQPSSRGNPRHPITQSVHHTTRGRAGRTYHLACRAKPTQGVDQ